MSQNSSKLPSVRRLGYVIGLPVWVFVGFMLAQLLVVALIAGLQAGGISFEGVNEAVFNATGAGIIYALAIGIVIGLPVLIKKTRLKREELGLQRMPAWLDLVWAPLGMVVYLVLTTIVMSLAEQVLTFVDYTQTQDTGFTAIASQMEYVLAFFSLVILAPIAEEILFRGYLFGKLRKHAPVWVAILITSLLFAFVHFQWNVAIDVFVLSIVLCLLRLRTGSLWAPIVLHMIKNGIAFYLLFVNPGLISTLGG